MSTIRQTQAIVPSLLDRLIDDDPTSLDETNEPTSQQINKLKNNIRRDLENLLNTRLRIDRDLKKFPELNKSLLNYGLPDFSHIPIESDSEHNLLANKIYTLIYWFEPRLINVNVEVEAMGDGFNRNLHVEISATLLVEPNPIPVLFDSQMQHIDRKLSIRELKHGR